MKKRAKKEIPEVKLSTQELIPSTIGVIDEKGKNSWALILLFGLLIVFVFALPIVTNYFQSEPEVVNPNPVKPSEKPNEEPSNNVTFYPLKNNLDIIIGGMSFSKIEVKEKEISITITNNSETKNYLSKHQMYFELYNNEKTLLQRIKLPEDNINKGSSLTATFDLLESVNDKLYQVVITEKTEEDYPPVNLKKDAEGNYSLTCKKGMETLLYSFNSEQKLFAIKDTLNYLNTNSDYQIKLSDCRQKSADFNSITGISTSIVEIGNGFTFNANLALDKLDLTDKNLLTELDNKAYFGKDTEGKVVYFELSTMNYQCSM